MIFYLHYMLLTSGLSGASVLLGVFFKTYSDASQGEIGILLMSFPFVSLVIKPLICSLADRHQRHQLYLILTLTVMLVGFTPFVVVPFFQEFYTKTPRLSWYLLVVACHIGSGALNVAWSLGDCLAVNMAQRKGTPFGRMRLVGTISWGVYGYIIGQINELPYMPKFVPAFLILHLSILIEIVLLLCWNKEDFKMIDPAPEITLVDESTNTAAICESPNIARTSQCNLQQLELRSVAGTPPSSVGGTLRGHFNSTNTLRNVLASEELTSKLRDFEENLEAQTKANSLTNAVAEMDHSDNHHRIPDVLIKAPGNLDSIEKRATLQSQVMLRQQQGGEQIKNKCNSKKSQLVIFKLILNADGRLIKYLLLFIMFGILLAPMNFVFLSLDDVCKTKGCNFSQLAGAVLISQAFSETLCFFVVPWFMTRISRSAALAFGMIILGARYFFYATYYYTSDISPYWALLGEWGHGISYGIFATILADVALMFANQSKHFIPDMRRLGFLSEIKSDNLAKVHAEEYAIKMALRATMQGVFGGFMDGLGQGLGSLVCGLIADAFSYIELWQLFTLISIGTGLVHQIVELTKCKWSDTYMPPKGTKAFQILNMNATTNEKRNPDSNCKPTTELEAKSKATANLAAAIEQQQ